VAASAICAKLAIMNIVGAVAVRAAVAEAELLVQRIAVAGLACNGCVSILQRERGLHIVIEAPERPFDRVVADATVIPEPPVMLVFIIVAVDAGSRCVLEYL